MSHDDIVLDFQRYVKRFTLGLKQHGLLTTPEQVEYARAILLHTPQECFGTEGIRSGPSDRPSHYTSNLCRAQPELAKIPLEELLELNPREISFRDIFKARIEQLELERDQRDFELYEQGLIDPYENYLESEPEEPEKELYLEKRRPWSFL